MENWQGTWEKIISSVSLMCWRLFWLKNLDTFSICQQCSNWPMWPKTSNLCIDYQVPYDFQLIWLKTLAVVINAKITWSNFQQLLSITVQPMDKKIDRGLEQKLPPYLRVKYSCWGRCAGQAGHICRGVASQIPLFLMIEPSRRCGVFPTARPEKRGKYFSGIN